jgi:signal transduction histidine kinase
VIDKNGLTKYVSPSYQRKIGRIIDNRVGKDSFEFIHPDDIENVKKGFAKLVLRSLVSNAIKFSNQNDEVIISIDTNEDMAVIK